VTWLQYLNGEIIYIAKQTKITKKSVCGQKWGMLQKSDLRSEKCGNLKWRFFSSKSP